MKIFSVYVVPLDETPTHLTFWQNWARFCDQSTQISAQVFAHAPKVDSRKIKKGKFEPLKNVSKDCNRVIKGMLKINPASRYTVEQALSANWFKEEALVGKDNSTIFDSKELKIN